MIEFHVGTQSDLQPNGVNFEVASSDKVIVLADSVGVADSLVDAQVQINLSDAIAIVDGTGFDVELRTGDSVGISDSLVSAEQTAFFIQLSDAINMFDRLDSLEVSLSLVDTFQVLDRLASAGENFFIHLVDAINVSDSVSSLDVEMALNDVIGIADSLASLGVQVNVTDAVAVGDSIQLEVEFVLSDGVSVADTLSLVGVQQAQVFQGNVTSEIIPEQIDQGEAVVIKAIFRDKDGNKVDPDLPVQTTIKNPDDTLAIEDENASKKAVGEFTYLYTTTQWGTYAYKLVSQDKGIVQGEFYVEKDLTKPDN